MTIHDLEQFRGMKNDCDMIKAEIESFYNPVSSPNGRTEPGHGTTPGNPTERAVLNQILPHEDMLEAKQKELMQKLKEINAWIETVNDYQVRALIRCYYVLGKTWKQTSIHIYGYPCPQRAHQRVHRFFGSREEI
jgi:hypothetical protein